MNIIHDISTIAEESLFTSKQEIGIPSIKLNKINNNKILKNLIEDIEDNNVIIPSPTNLRISTITAVCHTNMIVNLNKLFEHIDDFLIANLNTEGVIRATFANNTKGKFLKEERKKKKG